MLPFVGILGAVEALIAAGADPNARMDGYPALQLAVRGGTVEVVEALLAAGADVKAFGEWVPGCCQDRDTALHQAVRYWYVCGDGDIEYCPERAEVIQVLLAAGADVDARDELGGVTPLHAAANVGRWLEVPEMLLMLLGAGADPNAQNEYGLTPLHVAVGNISSTITVLLDAGADPKTRDGYGRTPLHLAANEGGPEILDALLDAGAELEARDHRGRTPLHRAAAGCRSPAVLAALVDAGADPKARDRDGRTPWDLARMNCATGSVPTTVHPPTAEPLHLAAAHGIDPEVVWLSEAGNRYWARGERGRDRTATWAAARNPDPSGVAELLQAGANLEERDGEGRTALHWAAGSSQSPAVVAALLDAGAELEARDDTGRTPLHWAAKWNYSVAVLATLVDAGAEVAARDEDDKTPLHWAAHHNESPAIVAALLESGAKVAARDEFGKTPLHWAALYKRIPGGSRRARQCRCRPRGAGHVGQHALVCGDGNQRGPRGACGGCPSFWRPARRWTRGQTEMDATARGGGPGPHGRKRSRCSLDAGADPNARTEDGWTPLQPRCGRHLLSGESRRWLDAGAALEARTRMVRRLCTGPRSRVDPGTSPNCSMPARTSGHGTRAGELLCT